MNCCDEFGHCNQGRQCPVRRPAVVARAKPLRRCEDLGVCMNAQGECRSNCQLHDPLPSSNDALAQRLANQDDKPLAGLELLLVWLLGLVVLCLAVAVGGALLGYLWARWGDAISNILWHMATGLM
jgi:hypothetical protein